MGDGVASAVVWQKSCKTVRLPSNASIFRAELYAISLALNIIRRCRDKDFIIFSDSMSSLQALSGFKLEIDLVQKILKDYTTLANSGKVLFCAGFQAMSIFLATRELMLQRSRLFLCPSQA